MNLGRRSTDRAPRVLIVDDDPLDLQLFEVLLQEEGLTLSTASGGEMALASIAEDPPDLILLDALLPDLDGYQVLASLKASPATKRIPVIMVTAHDDRRARLDALIAGAAEFVSKPVDRAELRVRIRNLLRLKAYGDDHDRYEAQLESEVDARTAALAESERLYRSTFETAPVGIAHIGLDGRWLHVNQHLCDILGYTRAELLQRTAQELMEPSRAQGEAASIAQLIAGKLERHVVEETSYLRSSGAVMWARVSVAVHRDADGQPLHFITVIEDITERRALEAQVRQASKMEAIGSLASGVAHDFNNLLSVVLSYSELLAAELKEGDPMRNDLLEIRDAGQRAVVLTRQLLAFSRQQVLQPKVVDLAEIVSGMETMVRRLIGEDVHLSVVAVPGLGAILVDPGQVEQVIMNLAVNARDAMPGGGTLAIEVALVRGEADPGDAGGQPPGSRIVLTVTDTGVGMDAATQARMFEPFFTTKEAGQGTGLGLATVFGVVRQSGGTIVASSELGVGTTFQITFPTVNRSPSPLTRSRPPDPRTLRGSETILLVEDEEAVRVLAATILRKYGYRVLEAENAGIAFLLSEQHGTAIDLLLTDVVMPRMSGRQLADRLRLLRPDMKVLYMSGYTDDAAVRHGVIQETIAFLQKPITPERLAAKVRETLDPPRS